MPAASCRLQLLLEEGSAVQKKSTPPQAPPPHQQWRHASPAAQRNSRIPFSLSSQRQPARYCIRMLPALRPARRPAPTAPGFITPACRERSDRARSAGSDWKESWPFRPRETAREDTGPSTLPPRQQCPSTRATSHRSQSAWTAERAGPEPRENQGWGSAEDPADSAADCTRTGHPLHPLRRRRVDRAKLGRESPLGVHLRVGRVGLDLRRGEGRVPGTQNPEVGGWAG